MLLKLIKAEAAARNTTRAILKKEVPMINELISKASEDRKFYVPININDYSPSVQALLKKAGYKVEYNSISWAHIGVEIDNNERELMKIAEEAGVEILKVQ